MTAWPIVMPARVEAGVLKINAQRLSALLKGRRDCDVEVLIERKHATRSLAQNALYWSVYVGTISDHTGYTKDEVHELLKAKFLPKHLAVADIHGELKDEFTIGRTTTTLNKSEFGEFMETVAQWAAEDLGLVIPSVTSILDDRRLT